ncbi:MAG: acyltransferase family protein [Acidimicrobiales bacterium]|nr:acyltransferase family protein [Acidimicrobiales bacterium]
MVDEVVTAKIALRQAGDAAALTTAVAEPSSRGRYGFSHVPALDGLRGAAVVAVLLYHGGHLTGGYLGVDLFFVLSGYLITSLLLAEHRRSGGIALGAFWGRRARRLLPALLLLLCGVAVYAKVLARPVDLQQIRGDAFATLAYVANWRTILHGSNYWDISLAPSPLQHVWSLAIEEQFYLVWPLLVVLVSRRRHDAARVVGSIAVVGALASAVAFVVLHHLGASDTRVYEGTDTRAVALLLGAALAAWRRWSADRSADRPVGPHLVGSPHPVGSDLVDAAAGTSRRILPPRALEAAGLVAAVALGVLWFRLDGQSRWVYRGGLPLASALAVVVVAAASRGTGGVLGRLLSIRPLRALGAISYGLYLWHWPIYQALDLRNGRLPGLGGRFLHDPVLLVVKLALSLLAAVVSYVVIESPIRHGAIRRPFGPPLAMVGIGVVAVVSFAATTGAIAPTAPGRVGQATAHVDGAPVVLFVGDSVALSTVGRVAADPKRYGINPVNRAFPGCSVVADGRNAQDFAGRSYRPASCEAKGMRDFDAIHPDLVFLLVGARPNDFVEIHGRFVRGCDPAFDRAYRTSTEALLRKLHAGGAPVVIGTVLHSSATAIPVEGAEDRIDCVNRQIRRVAAAVPDTSLVDTNDLLCPHGQPCIEELGGDPVRSDGLHFDAGPGGDRAADWIVAHVLRAGGLRAAAGATVHGG